MTLRCDMLENQWLPKNIFNILHEKSMTGMLKYGNIPDSKVHVTNMGPIWGRQDPGGPHVGLMNIASWDVFTLWSGNVAVFQHPRHRYTTRNAN